jgi:hypothetical protein
MEGLWKLLEATEISKTYVLNLPNGCVLKVVHNQSVSMVNIPGLILDNGKMRALTIAEMMGDEVGGMMDQMSGLMGTLGKFGR